jgi:hypothetical protein
VREINIQLQVMPVGYLHLSDNRGRLGPDGERVMHSRSPKCNEHYPTHLPHSSLLTACHTTMSGNDQELSEAEKVSCLLTRVHAQLTFRCA